MRRKSRGENILFQLFGEKPGGRGRHAEDIRGRRRKKKEGGGSLC